MLRPLLVAGAVLVLACMTPQGARVAKQQSVAMVDPSDREAAFSRALSAVQGRGWLIAVSDRAAGLLTTQTMDTGAKPCGTITCDSRSTLQVTIADTGRVVVNLHREFFLANGNASRWFTPTLDRDVAPIEAEQSEILAEIVSR